MRIWKRAAWRKKLLKSSSEFFSNSRRFASAIGNFIFILLVRLWGRGFASAEATKGHENKRSLRSPFGNLRCRYFWGFSYFACP